MSIFDVQHQPRAHRVLQRALAAGRMPHAYIFHGPDGVGKRTLAVRLARLLLCPNPREAAPPPALATDGAPASVRDACGACDDCTLVDAGTHPDMTHITQNLAKFHPKSEVRKSTSLDLGVPVVRHFLIEAAGTRPARGRAKVFLVPDAERMSPTAQNALLKTLEEPPPDTTLILLTRSLDRLLPTTRSRCQPVPFANLPVEFVAEQILVQRESARPDVAAFLARFSAGRLGVALQAFDDGYHEIKVSLGDRLARLGPDDAFALAKALLDDGKTLADRAKERHPGASATELSRIGLRALIALAATFYRDALRRAVGHDGGLTNADQQPLVDALARRAGAAGASAAIEHLNTAESNLDRNANVQLAVETLGVKLARTAGGTTVVAP